MPRIKNATPGMQGGVLRKDLYFAETGYIPHKGQIPVHYDNHRHRVLTNGRRWGKTFLGGKEAEPTAFVKNRRGEPQMGWIIGPNYLDCEKEFRVVYDTFKKLGIDTVSTKFLKNVENGNMHIHTNWGFDLECRSAQHPESLVGEGLDFVLLVEAGRLTRKTFTEYVRPALSDKRGWSLTTGVPELAVDTALLYWAYKKGLEHMTKPWRSWRMPSWTNNFVFPGGRRDPEILEAEDDLTKDEFARQYEGKFVDRVGRVMAEWDDELHLKRIVYNPDWPLYAAVDYGFTNFFVWLWIQVDEFQNVYVLGEHYIKEMDTERIAKEVLKDHPWTKKCAAFYPDPHNPDDTNILMRHLGIPARSNTGGELRTRNGMVRTRLKPRPAGAKPKDQQAGIVFDKDRCTHLAWEMREGYRWPVHKNEQKNESEVPLDKDNHGPEALGRFIYGYFGPGATTETGSSSRQSRAKVKN
jgi:hypothetical protein